MMRSLTLEIALTHLLTKRKQTIVAMLGVTFGISMFLVMISFMTGVNDFTKNLAMEEAPDIRIYNPLEIEKNTIIAKAAPDTTGNLYVVHHQRPKNVVPKLRNAIMLAQSLEAMPEVKGVAPQVATQVFFNNGPIRITGSLLGIDVKRQGELFTLARKMDAGQLIDLLGINDGVILGYGLANKMNVSIGDRLSITTSEGSILMLRVVGIFSYGLADFDNARAYATLATVQKVMQRDPSFITDLHIKMYNNAQAKAMAETISKRFGVHAEDWSTANAPLLAGESIRFAMTGIISFTLLLVAGFGIYNIMNMNIINKLKDIAILKATGFESRQIVGIFLWQSAIIGVLGGTIGLLLGYGFCVALSHTPFPGGSVVRIATMPVNFNPQHYIMGFSFGVITTILAGLFPSLKAAKVDPVQIIRG
ncbi:MAG TPA: FtsX-like permease family protein [Haliscomenobacter sp.]|uniref:ABC transporter permease n=1 Tax=Haliscomenobacter sp. TaxID=2717303 RepID=UPI002BCE836D|nr:FtsX-like permease family protein [Haliscomenobacter sp.]HOY17202.1 FtsX-like permease family protein [Haliscomenobacter sp.]